MEKRTPALLLLLLVAVFGTLGMACFFSAVECVPNGVIAASASTYYSAVFTDKTSHDYEVNVCEDLYFTYQREIENAADPIANIDYTFAFDGETYTGLRAHRIPSFAVVTILGGEYWFPDLKYAFVDTIHKIVGELDYNCFTLRDIETSQTLFSQTFNTANCDKIVFNKRRLELTLKDETRQDYELPTADYSFDHLVSSQTYTESNGPLVSAVVYSSQSGYSYNVNFIDTLFPEHNKVWAFDVDFPTDTIIVAEIDGVVPEIGDTGNYEFLGWFCGNITPNDPVGGNVTFFAKYQDVKITLKNNTGGWIYDTRAYVGDTLRSVMDRLDGSLFFKKYAIPQSVNLDVVLTDDCTITLAERLTVTLKYFKLERYSVEVEGKTFNYDMLTYKTVTRTVIEGDTLNVDDYDNAYYNIMGKPYYETMPGFTFTGWDYDLTQPITTPLTITAQYDLPKLKVKYYSANNILFETREYDLVKDGLLLPVPELPKSSFWDEFKNALANLLTLDIVQEVDDVLARLAADKMIDHLNGLYDDATNQIFAIVAKPDMNSDVYKGWQGDLSGDLEGSAFVRLKGSALNNNYVLYLNPTSMYIDNINYEIALSFGDHVIDPVINGVQNFFTGAWDWLSENWQTVLYVVGAAVAIILLIVFGPIVLPVIVVVVKFIAKAIKICFKAIGKVLGAIWTGIKRFCQWVGELFNKIFRRGK